MTDRDSLLDRMFNRPTGVPGRIGATLMTLMNDSVAVDVVDLLEIGPESSVLEIGFGPGLGIECAASVATDGYVAGVDISEMMVERASRRNQAAIEAGRVDLRRGSVDDLPFSRETFDAAFSINSLHAWPDATAGLDEIRRVLKPRGSLAIVLTKHAGRPDEPIEALLRTAGFERIEHVERTDGDCVLGKNPESA